MKSKLMMLVKDEGYELHFAPIQGGLCVMKDGIMKHPESWPEHHELMDEFLQYRRLGNLRQKGGESKYGPHIMFDAHSGRYCVYEWKN